MSESRILVRLLLMYFPRNWEFGSALPNFGISGGEGGLNTPLSLSLSVRHWQSATVAEHDLVMAFPLASSELKRSDGLRGIVNHPSGRYRWGLSLGANRPGLEGDQSPPCSAVAQNICGYIAVFA